MASETLYHLLEAVQANMSSVSQPAYHSGFSYSAQPSMKDALVANNVQRNYINNKTQKAPKDQKSGPCRDFTAGRWKRDNC